MCRIVTASFLLILAEFSTANFSLPIRAADLPSKNEDKVVLPRYRFKVGQELVYQFTGDEDLRASNDAKNEKGKTAQNQKEWQILVVRQNDNGSWRLYIRSKLKSVNPDGTMRRKVDSLGYCDLHPDGSYSLDEQTAVFEMLFPWHLFCRLPDTTDAIKKGWKYEPPLMGGLLSYSLAKRDNTYLHIAGIPKTAYSEGDKRQTTLTYDFDTQQGLVVKIDNEWKNLASDHVISRTTVRLTSNTYKDTAWIARFQEDAQRYLKMHEKWNTLCYEGMRAHTVGACKAARIKARALLVVGREKAELNLLRDLYDDTIQCHDNDEKWMTYYVKMREKFFAEVPKFSTTWEAKNFDGSTFRLADYRGKVVILYFWNSGCEYNILAAPQICQLAADFQNKKDVAVVGMFMRNESSNDEERTKYLTGKCFQGIPQLKANDIAALYRFQQYELGCPSILVLDQTGKVHEVFVGYASDLAQKTRKIVEDLRSKRTGKD